MNMMTDDYCYAMNFRLSDSQIEKIFTDVLIIGSGIGGLYTALNLNNSTQIILISKEELIQNNTSLAQGGIAVPIGSSDKPSYHYKDTMMAGRQLNDKKAVKILVGKSVSCIEKLIDMGVEFDRDENGILELTREGGHSRNRILHAGGDITGERILKTLVERVVIRPNIKVMENTFIIDLLMLDNKCIGALAIKAGHVIAYIAKYVVLATGGIGQIFHYSTNANIATGDGIAMAYRKGIKIKDMRYIQFHPTVLYKEGYEKPFLISEAVRGEGGILRDKHGEIFMEKYSEMKELAPRDIVSKAIMDEMIRTDSKFVYLDITHKSPDFIKHRFPNIYRRCMELGIDMCTQYIPVAPAQHYIMGGIETNHWAETSIKDLYACGECACTGVHGANRLASNSLLEALVFAERIAYKINKVDLSKISIDKDYQSLNYDNNRDLKLDDDIMKISLDLKQHMNYRLGPVDDIAYLHGLHKKVNKWFRYFQNGNMQTKISIEVYNMLTVAKLILDDLLSGGV